MCEKFLQMLNSEFQSFQYWFEFVFRERQLFLAFLSNIRKEEFIHLSFPFFHLWEGPVENLYTWKGLHTHTCHWHHCASAAFIAHPKWNTCTHAHTYTQTCTHTHAHTHTHTSTRTHVQPLTLSSSFIVPFLSYSFFCSLALSFSISKSLSLSFSLFISVSFFLTLYICLFLFSLSLSFIISLREFPIRAAIFDHSLPSLSCSKLSPSFLFLTAIN